MHRPAADLAQLLLHAGGMSAHSSSFPPTVPSPPRAIEPSVLRATLGSLALQDGIVLVYLAILLFAAAANDGPARSRCVLQLGALLGSFCTMLLLVRGRGLRSGGTTAPLVYRVVTYGVVQLSYFVLRDLLPMVAPHSYDEALHRLDVRLLGVEPTLWLDGHVTPFATEWFSFFYYGYFWLLGAHVLPMAFMGRGRALLAEFGFAVVLLVCVTHLLYFVVPGFGPVRHLEGAFAHPLPNGPLHDLVMRAVARNGAQKDVFPSLHTGAPVMLAIFSFRHRRLAPFRYTWPVVTFFALNIVGATLYLRWHWTVDVIAGATLAVASLYVATRVCAWETTRRDRLGLGPVWPALRSGSTSVEPT